MINQQSVEVFVSKTKDWFVWSWFESSYTNDHTDNIDCEIKSKYDPRKMMGDFRFLFFKFEIYTSYSVFRKKQLHMQMYSIIYSIVNTALSEFCSLNNEQKIYGVNNKSME